MGADELFEVRGRTALITGASGGLGRHFASTLARHGARVLLAARRTEHLAEVESSIRSEGGEAQWVHLDVTESASVAGAFDAAEAAFGTVTILVNNAGVAIAKPALALEVSQWDQVVDTNLKGAWLVATEAARRMVAAGRGGSIINIASIVGLRVAGGLSSYAASKAGLVHLTRSLALELARHDIRVNRLAPGYILTDINTEFFSTPAGESMIKRIPQRRLGSPRDLDGVLLLLASDASAYMTGSVVTVDGGHLHSSL